MNTTPTFQHHLKRQMRYYALALHSLRLPRLNRGLWVGCAFPILTPTETERPTWSYGAACLEDAKAYLAHPLLRSRLEECTQLLMNRTDRWVRRTTIVKHIHACMTLFATAAGEDSLYQQMLDRFFKGAPEREMKARLDCADGFARQDTELVKYYGDEEEVRVPEDITVIGARAFVASSNLRSVILPSGVTAIHPFAFWSCRQLEHINLPEQLRHIGYGAFFGCHRLANEQGLVIVGNYLFDSIGKQSHVVVPQGVTCISRMAFLSHRHALQSITLPSSLQRIDGDAFTGCTQLRQVYLPSPSPIIAFNAFKDSPEVTFSSIHQEALGQQ